MLALTAYTLAELSGQTQAFDPQGRGSSQDRVWLDDKGSEWSPRLGQYPVPTARVLLPRLSVPW